MIAYAVKRLLSIVPVLVGVSMIVFLLIRLIPGDPATVALGSRATPELIQQARDQFHLNDPIWRQYWDFVVGAFHGNVGVSYFYGTSVWPLVTSRVFITVELLAYASVLSLLLTFPLATIAAAKRERAADQAIRIAATTALGIPPFWLGLMLSLYLGVRMHLFPIEGNGSGGLDTLYHLTLPALTVAIGMAPLQIRALRGSLLDVMGSDYVRTARASGLRARFLVGSYMWRNSTLPLITVFTANLGWLIGGTVVVEQVFSIDGLGTLLLNSVSTRDYAVIQFVTLVLALFIVVVNLATDLAYVILDPRIELHT